MENTKKIVLGKKKLERLITLINRQTKEDALLILEMCSSVFWEGGPYNINGVLFKWNEDKIVHQSWSK